MSFPSKIRELPTSLQDKTNLPIWIRRLIKCRSWGHDFRREQHLKEAARLASGRLLDVGCGRKQYEDYFDIDEYIGIELLSSHSRRWMIDVYADGFHIPFRSQSFDTALCTQVLEHVPEPSELLAEINRVLKPGGLLILTAPHTSFLHEEPHDYYRFTKYGLHYLFETNQFEVKYIRSQGGYWLCGGSMFSYYLWSGGYIRQLLTWPLILLVQAFSYILDAIDLVEEGTVNYIIVGTRAQT
jgi:SAM-dependent methyltransferase